MMLKWLLEDPFQRPFSTPAPVLGATILLKERPAAAWDDLQISECSKYRGIFYFLNKSYGKIWQDMISTATVTDYAAYLNWSKKMKAQ